MEKEQHLRRTAAAAATEPFDLESGPLTRFSLASLTDSEHVLIVVQHHIITDGWSAALVGKELAAIYRALRENQPLPEAPQMQFADYARWEQANLSSLEKERTFWTQ